MYCRPTRANWVLQVFRGLATGVVPRVYMRDCTQER